MSNRAGDLQAAAERIREWLTEHYDPAIFAPRLVADILDLAAEYPDDNDDPADAAFVRSLGRPVRDDGNCVVVWLTPPDAHPFVRAVWARVGRVSVGIGLGEAAVFVTTPTKGRMRRLLVALGVPGEASP